MTKHIAFLGKIGTYSDIACREAVADATPLPCASFVDVFAALKKGDADYAMMPIENSIAGRVADVHLLLPESGFFAIGEHYQRVEHHLVAVKGAKLSDIKTVQSHPQALSQCRLWLQDKGFAPSAFADTASAAADVAKRVDKSLAAIASSLTTSLYGLDSLAADIADQKNNTTRFLIFAREPQTPPLDVPSMTSLLFRVKSVPAALYKALGGFATNGINITKLESYLVGDRFDAAQFYMDTAAHKDSIEMKRALDELAFFAHSITLLGSYPSHPFRMG